MSLQTDCLALCILYGPKRRAKFFQLAYNKYSEEAMLLMFAQLYHRGLITTPRPETCVLTHRGRQKLESSVYKLYREGKWKPRAHEDQSTTDSVLD